MNPSILKLKKDNNLNTFINDFPLNQVVLKNYFYFTNKDFFKNYEIYSDEEIGIILNLTDREYADLVLKITTPKSKEIIEQDLNKDAAHITELEEKLRKSQVYEESKEKVEKLESELQSIDKDLSAVSEIQTKYEIAAEEYKNLSKLSKYNLGKIHEDLVSILDEINQLEQQLLEHKGEVIQKVYKKTQIDKGKIWLAAGLGLGILLLGAILFLLDVSKTIIGAGYGVGLVLVLMIIYTAKIEVDYPQPDLGDKELTPNEIKSKISDLSVKKRQILDLVGVKTAEEFFNMKAKLGASVKSLKYLQDQRSMILEGQDYNKLIENKNSLQNQIQQFKANLQDGVFISPDEYLKIRREIDSLKMNVNQGKENIDLSSQEMLQKLSSIKKELEYKLPEFCDILRINFKNYFTNIKSSIDSWCQQYELPMIIIDENAQGYDALSNIQKFFIQYALFKNLYQKDFVFGVDFIDSWSDSEKNFLTKFISGINRQECEFYLLEFENKN